MRESEKPERFRVSWYLSTGKDLDDEYPDESQYNTVETWHLDQVDEEPYQ